MKLSVLVCALTLVVFLGCGGSVRTLGAPSWSPALSCPTSVGDFHFERSPGGCAPADFYADQLVSVMGPVSGSEALPVLPDERWQLWFWDAEDLAGRDGALGSWQLGEPHVWLERCGIGLAHEVLHQWDVMRLGSVSTGDHARWQDADSHFKDVDVTWQYHVAAFWCSQFIDS